MNSGSEIKQNNTLNATAWLGTILVTALALFATYYYKFSTPILSMMWIGWFIVTLLLIYFTTQGKKAYLFALEAKNEIQKVVWPDRKETVQTTTIVMAMVGVTGFVLWLVDMSMMWVIGKITHLG